MLQKSGVHQLRLVVEIPGNLPGFLPPRWFSRRISEPSTVRNQGTTPTNPLRPGATGLLLVSAAPRKKKLDVKLDVFQKSTKYGISGTHRWNCGNAVFDRFFEKKTIDILLIQKSDLEQTFLKTILEKSTWTPFWIVVKSCTFFWEKSSTYKKAVLYIPGGAGWAKQRDTKKENTRKNAARFNQNQHQKKNKRVFLGWAPFYTHLYIYIQQRKKNIPTTHPPTQSIQSMITHAANHLGDARHFLSCLNT